MKWKKILAAGASCLFLIGSAIIFYAVFFTTPRMRSQHSIRHFEAPMPLAPPRSIPLELDTPQPGASGLPAATAENIAAGAVYYGYYCLFCHGEQGDGEGPVGHSYLPKPADLRGGLQDMDDAALIRAMLLGSGHEPVVNRVVPQAYHGYLALYLRSLSGKKHGVEGTTSSSR